MLGKKEKKGKEIRGPELIGRSYLVNQEGQRYKFKYLAPAVLHPYYDRLIEENRESLLEEAEDNGDGLEVTDRFREEAERLYNEEVK